MVWIFIACCKRVMYLVSRVIDELVQLHVICWVEVVNFLASGPVKTWRGPNKDS